MPQIKKYLIEIKCPCCEKYRTIGKHGMIRAKRTGVWTGYCNKCAAIKRNGLFSYKNSPNWKGGRSISPDGYIQLVLDKNDPYVSMAEKMHKRVPEHRYIMACYLGRCLKKKELVHHINGNKTDNRIENLMIVTAKKHGGIHFKNKIWIYNQELQKREWRINYARY
jgi:hypothetical protein